MRHMARLNYLTQQAAGSFTVRTADYVDMTATVWALKHAGNQEFVIAQGISADRTEAGKISFKTVKAAADVHKTVHAACNGRISAGADQLALVQNGGAYRADLRFTRSTGFSLWMLSQSAKTKKTKRAGRPEK